VQNVNFRGGIIQVMNEMWRILRLKHRVFSSFSSSDGLEEGDKKFATNGESESEEIESAVFFLSDDENLNLLLRLFTSLSNRNIFRAMVSDFSQILLGLQHPECLLMYE